MMQTPGLPATSGALASPQASSGTFGFEVECGSSISRIASLQVPWDVERIRLVIFVLRKTVTFEAGICAPSCVGIPPVQFNVTSPTSSVKPSARIVGGTPALATHWSAGALCALATAANAATAAKHKIGRD